MQELIWNVTKFNHILSYPSAAPAGAEAYAQDMLNLRVDRWGHLRLRPVIRALQMDDESDIASENRLITGVAATARELYWLRSDGKLFVANSIAANPSEIRNAPNLEGRLSIVGDIGDFAVITSEGDDNGYIVYYPDIVARTLHLEPPNAEDFHQRYFVNPELRSDYAISYDATNSRFILLDSVPGDLSGTTMVEDVSFSGNTIILGDATRGTSYQLADGDVLIVSSPITNAGAVQVLVVGSPALPLRHADGSELDPGDLQAGYTVEQSDKYTFYKLTFESEGGAWESEPSERFSDRARNNPEEFRIRFVLPHEDKPTDNRVKFLNLYRSSETRDDEDADDDNLLYFRVGRTRLPRTAIDWGVLDNESHGEHNVLLPLRDNSKMPSEITQIARFNDRLFGAAGDELRFSDVRNLTPNWGAWPILNSIQTGTPIEFCAAYRGMLLFGGANNLYRLSGSSPATFGYDQISSRGPVSPHAWGVLGDALGFVGSDGLYLTDGTRAPETAPQLEGYFNRHEIEEGLAGTLPNKASLWGVSRRRKRDNHIDQILFVKNANDWSRLAIGDERALVKEYTTVKFDGFALTGVIADQGRAPRLIDWVVDDGDVDALTKYTGQVNPPTEEIAWSWESQQLDWNSQGLGSEMKTFKELAIDGKAENDITATFYIDEQEPVEETVSAMRAGGDRFDYRRIRIDRRGFSLRFKITGTGNVTIRGLKVRAYV